MSRGCLKRVFRTEIERPAREDDFRTEVEERSDELEPAAVVFVDGADFPILVSRFATSSTIAPRDTPPCIAIAGPVTVPNPAAADAAAVIPITDFLVKLLLEIAALAAFGSREGTNLSESVKGNSDKNIVP